MKKPEMDILRVQQLLCDLGYENDLFQCIEISKGGGTSSQPISRPEKSRFLIRAGSGSSKLFRMMTEKTLQYLRPCL